MLKNTAARIATSRLLLRYRLERVVGRVAVDAATRVIAAKRATPVVIDAANVFVSYASCEARIKK